MTATADKPYAVTSVIRHGQSWADQADSPGWAARSPPKFSEGMPEIVLDEQEYDRLPASAGGASTIPIFVGGLDYCVESKDLEEFFANKGCKVARVRVLKQNGKSSGKAFLNVADQVGLAAVLKLSGSTLAGRQLTIKEDSGPRPVRSPRTERVVSDRFERPQATRIGGRWREEEKPKPKTDTNWHAIGKGGKIVDAPVVDTRKKRFDTKDGAVVSKPATPVANIEAVAEDAPKERKRLALKPRSKPVGESAEVAESRPSAIFGAAKPRDEFAYQKKKSDLEEAEAPAKEDQAPAVTESAPVAEAIAPKRREKREPKPVVEVVPVVAVPEPVKAAVAPKKRTNRFAVDSSSSESEDNE